MVKKFGLVPRPIVPFGEPPQPPPPDFERQAEEWEKRATEFMELVQSGQQQIQQLTTRLEIRTPAPARTWLLREFARLPSNMLEWEPFFPVTTTNLQALRAIRQDIEIAATDIERNDFYSRLYSQVPSFISFGGTTNPEEILNWLKPPPGVTAEELEEIHETITGMAGTITGIQALPEMALEAEVPELPPLVAPPTVVTAPPTTISRLTIDAIIKSMTAPDIPESVMTEGEWVQFMIESGQISDKADLETVEFYKDQADQFVAEWQERNNMLAAFREGIAEMPDYELIDFGKEMVIQPGLALLEAARFYFEHVSMPIAGLVYKEVFGWLIPDLDAAYQRYVKAEEPWQALAHAWEEWDAPFGGAAEFILKYILMEGFVDPATWVGWGVYTRILKPLSKIGLGSIPRWMGVVERGIAETLEIPFNMMKWPLKARYTTQAVRSLAKLGIKVNVGDLLVPRTLGQNANIVMNISRQNVAKFMELRFGKAIRDMTMKEWSDGVDIAVKYTLKRPQIDNDITRAGGELLRHTPVTEREILDMSQRLKTTLSPEDITRQTAEAVDRTFEDFFSKVGGGKKLITNREAGDELVRILHGGMDTDMSIVAGKILSERSTRIISGAGVFNASRTPYKALFDLGVRNRRLYMKADVSAVALSRKQMGRMTTLLADIPTRIQRAWARGIDKWVVRPFAESYLAFAMYGPMNILEDTFRSMLGGVRPSRLSIQAFERENIGLIWDRDLVRDAISETYGYLRGRPQGELNNWILQIGGLAKGFGDRIYEVLVRKPGQVGVGMRRNFINEMKNQIMKRKGGDQYLKLANIGPNKLSGITSRKITKDVQQAATRLKVQGAPRSAFESLKADYTRANVMRKEVDSILMEHPDLPRPVRDFLMRQQDDGLIFREAGTSINGTMVEANKVMIDDFVQSAEYAHRGFEQLADMLTQLEVRNPQEMAQLIQSLNLMSSVYGATPKQILGRAVERTRGLPFPERRASIDQALDNITIFRERAGASMDKLVDRIKLAMREPAKLNEVDWTQIDLRIGGYADEVKKLVDELPLNIKFNVKTIRFDARLKRYNARWSPRTRTITIKDPEHIPSIYHEIAHSLSNDAIDAGNWSLIRGFAGDDVIDDIYIKFAKLKNEIVAQPKHELRGLSDYELLYGHVPGYKEIEEGFAEKFSGYIKGQADVVDDPRMMEFFSEHFPKTQREIPFPPQYVDKATHLFNLQTAKRIRGAELGEEISAWRHQFFADADPAALKTNAFWDDFDAEILGREHVANVEMADFDGTIKNAIDDLDIAGGLPARQRPAIKVTDRELSPNDVAQLIGARGDDVSRGLLDVITAQNDRDMFVSYVMAHVKKDVDIGFTKESIGAVHDQIVRSLQIPPEKMDWLAARQIELEAVRRDFHALYNSKLLPDDEVAGIGKYLDGTADAVEKEMFDVIPGRGKKPPTKVLKDEYATYNDLRQSSIDEAHKWYYKEFTDYSNANAFDAMMKAIYPFWTYESQRWFWLPRSFVRHPGTFTAFERWQNNTDYGYIHIPGTSADINPFRGTIYGTLSTRLARRDYPEYYDSLGAAGDVIEFSDFLSRYGFYPGAHIGIPLAVFGGVEMQFGEALPAIIKTPLDALIAMFPESENVKWISERIFGDRFRNYITIIVVNKLGGDGTLIFTKTKEGVTLTEEEQQIWDDARREVGWYSAAFEQFGLFRFRTDEQYEMYERAGLVIEEMTGYTPEQQDWLRKHGYRLWDMVGGMSPSEQAILQEMDYYRWVGNIRPLLPGRQQEILNKIELGWNAVEKYGETTQKNKLQLQRDFLSGARGPDDYNTQLLDLYDKQREFIDNKIEEYPLMSLENRADYYKEFNVPQPVLHPMRELLNLFFSIELKETTDPETGEIGRDWDNFWAQRQAIEDAIPDDLKQEWSDFLTRNSTRVEEIRREVYQNYFRTYNKVWEKILSTYPENEQVLVEEYLFLERTGQKLDRQAEIKATQSEKTGNMLISSFRSEVSEARQALRYHNPNLDAWLFYWGKTTTFVSPTGQEVYESIAKETGRRI